MSRDEPGPIVDYADELGSVVAGSIEYRLPEVESLFAAPAPAGLTIDELDVPDAAWRRAARARRSS